MFGPAVDIAIANHALLEFPREACGVVTAEGYRPLDNLDPNPEEAFDCAEAVAALQLAGTDILALVHSHPHRPADNPEDDHPACEGPSESDMRQQAAMDIPWGLILCDGTNTNPVLWWGPGVAIPHLVGRPFRHGPSGSDGRGDCYALIKDWYLLERGIILPEGPRDDHWWEVKRDLYRENFAAAGFERIDFRDIEVGDVALAHVLSEQVNHGGVYLGNGLLLHHLAGKLSRIEPIGRWQHLITMVLRYRGKEAADAA